MSNFLTEGKGKGSQLAGAEIEAAEVPAEFMRNLNAALKSPLLVVPKPFVTWMIDLVTSSGFDVPVSQLVGFDQFTVKVAAAINTSETTTSTVFADLATVGPQLTGLPDGKYTFLWGATIGDGASQVGVNRMGIKINGAEATNEESLSAFFAAAATAAVTLMMAATNKTLSNGGDNTVTARYKTADGTAVFEKRWLFAIRNDNL